MTPDEAKLDIFSGQIDNDAMWLESVDGLPQARDRMRQIAAEKPGRYFIFSPARNAVLAETDTLPKAVEASQAKSTAA